MRLRPMPTAVGRLPAMLVQWRSVTLYTARITNPAPTTAITIVAILTTRLRFSVCVTPASPTLGEYRRSLAAAPELVRPRVPTDCGSRPSCGARKPTVNCEWLPTGDRRPSTPAS